MPITALDLLKRSEKGSALTATEFDNNYTLIETAVNALITQVAAKHNDDGTLKTDAVSTAAMVANSILTLAKLAALTGTDKGGFLRADATTGVIAAAHLHSAKDTVTTAVDSTGAQAGLTLSTHVFNSVPAGDVLVFVKMHARRNAGDNSGTLRVKEGSTIIDDTATHGIDGAGTSWMQFILMGRIDDFAGGTLTLTTEFETSQVTSDVTFGVDGEGRFGRSISIFAGL